MDRTDYSNMTNSELKLAIETLQNEFDAKKSTMLKLCEEIEEIQKKYNAINGEINLRKNMF
jgi:uncharacterized coiled-coil DUF342 family protein